MEITLRVYAQRPYPTAAAKVEALLAYIGGGATAAMVMENAGGTIGEYRFTVPKAFTGRHPAIEYLINHA